MPGLSATHATKTIAAVSLYFAISITNANGLGSAHSPSLTVETYGGEIYFVRLEDYLDPDQSQDDFIILQFDTVRGSLSTDLGNARDIPWHDVRRMFISFTPLGYNPSAPSIPLGEQVAKIRLTDMQGLPTLPIRTTPLPSHNLRMTDGYDNAYPLTPKRIVDQLVRLGYSGKYVLYMGISKFHSQTYSEVEGRYIVDPSKPILNAPTVAWLTDFLARLVTAGFTPVISVSFEILGMWMPDDWNQRDASGNLARTGWQPPSGLVRPTSADGLAYLRDVFLAVLALLPSGSAKHLQIGEPWWWDGSFGSGAPHIYDFGTLTKYNAETGLFAPSERLTQVTGAVPAAQLPYLEWLRDQLGRATDYLRDEVLSSHPDATSYLLVFTPQILRDDAPMLRILNFPQTHWSAPAFDILQIEDYDRIIAGDFAFTEKTWLLATAILQYPAERVEYFAGFNLLPETTWVWANTDRAIWSAFTREPSPPGEVYVWSRSQVMRDGWLFDRQAWKTYPVCTTLAQCWKIERTDGVTQAFTSHDKPIVFDSITYKPAHSFAASQLASDTEMSVADVELIGAIDSNDISATNLLAGVYDHAAVTLFVLDWRDLSIPRTIVRRGWIGSVGQEDTSFRAELRGLSQRIQQPVIDSYSPECRVDLYSPECGAERDTYAAAGTVSATSTGQLGVQSDNRIFFATGTIGIAGYYAYGELRWLTGANAGRMNEVRASGDGRLELWEPTVLAVAVGDTFTIWAGCDKSIETCRMKFANAINFRGEPHVPGGDAMLRYPDPK